MLPTSVPDFITGFIYKMSVWVILDGWPDGGGQGHTQQVIVLVVVVVMR